MSPIAVFYKNQERIMSSDEDFHALQTKCLALSEELALLRESEGRFRQIAENVREVFFLISSQTDEILYISPAYERVWGRSCESLYADPQSWLLAIHPDDCWLAIATLETQFKTGEEFVEEYRIIRPDGSVCWVLAKAFPVRDEMGQVHRFVGIAEDITTRKEAEEALRHSEEHFRLIFEQAPIGMAVTDLEGRFQRVNPAFCQVLGYEAAELLLLGFEDITHPEEVELNRGWIRHLLEGTDPNFQAETRYVTKNLLVIDALLKVVLVYDKTGDPIGLQHQIVDISERKRMEIQLIHDAFHDALTRLPNRALFLDRLEQALRRSEYESSSHFAVLFLDVDRFKVVNDSVGHLVGDELLCAIAQRLLKCLRPMDTVARLGGDEFTILLEGIDSIYAATEIADKIQQELAHPFILGNRQIFTTVSIGITYCSGNYSTPEDVLRDADLTMYRAKDLGRSRYEIFNESLRENAFQKLQLETDLRLGIQNQEFQLYYQPIIDLKTQNLSGFEALLRWQHPTKGLVSPIEFIQLAEETGLIIPLGKWVLQESCRQLKEWQDKFPQLPPIQMSINLSGRQLKDIQLLDDIDEIIIQTGVNPKQIKLELTESILIEKVQDSIDLMRQLRQRNFELSIDDFGTGYSSLNYLRQFPINTVKIDGSFVRQMQSNKPHDENLEIIRAITALAHILNLNVVAEGIETEEQLEQICSVQCEYGQGYLFSRPMTIEDAAGLIADGLKNLGLPI